MGRSSLTDEERERVYAVFIFFQDFDNILQRDIYILLIFYSPRFLYFMVIVVQSFGNPVSATRTLWTVTQSGRKLSVLENSDK